MEQIISFFSDLPPELIILIVASLPIIELRGAVPLGLSLGINPVSVFFLSFLGNMIPLIPWYYLLKPLFNRLKKTKAFRRSADWFYERTMAKNRQVKKYGLWGLIIFVGIPLPGTGGWTGMALASFMGLKVLPATLAVAAGLVIAGFAVISLFSLGGSVLDIFAVASN